VSTVTNTFHELLYVSVATGTQLNTFTTEDQLQKTLPHVKLPAGFFEGAGLPGKSLKVKALLRVGTTATPTFTYSVRLLTSTTWSAAGVVWSSAAITHGTVTLAPVELEFDLTCSIVGAGGAANSTVRGIGSVRAGTAFAAGGGVFSIPAANTAFTNVIDTSIAQYLYLSVACGTSSASNLAQLELLKVYGEN
jgi:hypothetical protein